MIITPEQAREVWDSMERPSLRRVGKACGVSHEVIRKWKRQGWRANPNPVPRSDPWAQLDAAVPALTGDPMKRLDSIPSAPGGSENWDRASLDSLSEAIARVSKLIAAKAELLIADKPTALGDLLINCAQAAAHVADGRAKQDARNASRAVDVTRKPTPPAVSDLLADSIAAWRAAAEKARNP